MKQSELLLLRILIISTVLLLKASSRTTCSPMPGTPPNSPIGRARGINPGRVTWSYPIDWVVMTPSTWDGDKSHNWWEPIYTEQKWVDFMLRDGVRVLVGSQQTPAVPSDAWDQIFKYFNKEHGRGEVGYVLGEKIAIKVNLNTDQESESNNANSVSPQLIKSVVRQLVNVAGVPEGVI